MQNEYDNSTYLPQTLDPYSFSQVKEKLAPLVNIEVEIENENEVNRSNYNNSFAISK